MLLPNCVRKGRRPQRSCVLRLHCGAGVAKLTSGDPAWASLTALSMHHETQPLPTRLAPLLHRLPMRAHRLATPAQLVSCLLYARRGTRVVG